MRGQAVCNSFVDSHSSSGTLGSRDSSRGTRAFDPDHYSHVDEFDVGGNAPGDNIHLAGAPVGVGATLAAEVIRFKAGDKVKSTVFEITSRQPGNNFIVAAARSDAILGKMKFKDDGKTLAYPVAGEEKNVPDGFFTATLTVWRSLWLEKDSMSAPEGEEFDGAGGVDDDVNPGNIGAPNTGLLISNYQPAQIAVRVLPAELDENNELSFIRHLPDAEDDIRDAVNAVRDVPSELDFWVIHVFGAYEWEEDNDNDPNDESATPG